MSLDLFQEGPAVRLPNFRPLLKPEPGVFDNFLGAGSVMMQGFAETARAVDFAGSVGPIVHDAITGGTERQDRYFKEHDEVFGGAVKHWTPEPGEVGVAGQVVGKLLSTLPVVMMSPALAVGATGLSVAEDLAAKGVSPVKATAVGMTQAAGLGVGIWLPILGTTGWQRIALGGVGFNIAQGVATRGVSAQILKGTSAAEDFKALDPEALTLDVLLGAAFGAMAHLSPAQRAQGVKAWESIGKWGKSLKPSEADAIAALRQAEHINVDSVGGKPADLPDIEAHVNRMRTALDQFGRDQPISVEDLPAPKVDPDGRFAEANKRAQDLVRQAKAWRMEDGLPDPDLMKALRDRVDLKPEETKPGEPVSKEVTARMAERERLQVLELRRGEPGVAEEIARGREQLRKASDASQRIQATPEGAAKATADPLAAAAERFATDNAELQIRVGESASGEPVTMTAKQYLEQSRADAARARADIPLFEAAARCLFGAGA